MTNQFTAENPDEIKFTVTLTYPLSVWKAIAIALDTKKYNWGLDELHRDLFNLVRQAEKVYYPEREK